MKTKHVHLDNISIVLYGPRFPENIGSSARAMQNMGINKLVVVKPQNCDLSKILKLATHSSIDIIEQMHVYENLEEALENFSYIVGTTARLGGERPVVIKPYQMAQELISISQENEIAILFGPEDRGLTNKQIKFCHNLVNIPTLKFSSLNLSQAVMVICYELYNATRFKDHNFTPRLATTYELEAMYSQLQNTLIRIGFIQHENPEHWMLNVRRFFSRVMLRAKDVRIVRGICRQIEWYVKEHSMK